MTARCPLSGVDQAAGSHEVVSTGNVEGNGKGNGQYRDALMFTVEGSQPWAAWS